MSLAHDSESYKLSESADRKHLKREQSADVNHYHAHQTHIAGSEVSESAISVENRSTEQQFNIIPPSITTPPPIVEPEKHEYASITQASIREDRNNELSKSFIDRAVEENERIHWDVNTSAPLGDSSTSKRIEKSQKPNGSVLYNKETNNSLNHNERLSSRTYRESKKDPNRLEHDMSKMDKYSGRLNHVEKMDRVKSAANKVDSAYRLGKRYVKDTVGDEDTESEKRRNRLRTYRKTRNKVRRRLKHHNDSVLSENAKNNGLKHKSNTSEASVNPYYERKKESIKMQESKKNEFKRLQRKKRNRTLFLQKEKEQNILLSTLNLILGKRNKKIAEQASKKAIKTVFSMLGGSFLTFFIPVVFLLIFALILFYTYMVIMGGFTSPNELSTMSGTSEYMQSDVAELEYYLTDPEGIEEYKEILLEEESVLSGLEHEVDEWIFNVPSDWTWSVQELIAYFSAKYHTYEVDAIKAECDEIFEKWFTRTVELEIIDKPIVVNGVESIYKYYKVTVTVEKHDLSAIIKEYADALPDSNQYYMFLESSNGQQTYGPIMALDWSSRVTSGFGPRTAPKTQTGYGTKYHGGVDIGVPIGTPLYAPFDGVIECSYNEGGYGYYVKMTNDQGWVIIFGHLSNNSVVPSGSRIIKGQPVALSGNSGNSSGPHVHLELRDPDGNKYDPRFYVPCTYTGLPE